jgi:hypothetical protein
VDAESSRLIGGGRDDATMARIAPHYDRNATQCRIITLFHRCVERIEVCMNDASRHGG